MTVDGQEVKTPETETKVENGVETQATENNSVEKGNENKPYKTFATQEEFDKHSAGILNSAKNKAEKELLAMLGLKPDEKDKLAKFKEAYDATLSESEKQAKSLETLKTENDSLKSSISEKDALIVALTKLTGKSADDVGKYVRMAKGLVDENTTIEQALEQVLEFAKVEPKNTVPQSKPLNEPNSTPKEDNPFKTGNLTKQGELIKNDREKARAMYMAVYGKAPNW